MPPRRSNAAAASDEEPVAPVLAAHASPAAVVQEAEAVASATEASEAAPEPTEASPPSPIPQKIYKEPKPPKPREDDTLSVEDLNLPKSIVQRLAKGVLPPNTQIQKDALLAMSKGATVFVNYLTSTSVPPTSPFLPSFLSFLETDSWIVQPSTPPAAAKKPSCPPTSSTRCKN